MPENGLARIISGAKPGAIIAAALAHPHVPANQSIEFDPDLPADHGGGLLVPGRQNSLTLPAADGTLVRPTTPEQMIALLVSLIATAPTAMMACVRVKQEVAGWRFENSKGEIT